MDHAFAAQSVAGRRSALERRIAAFHARYDCLYRGGFMVLPAEDAVPSRGPLSRLVRERFETLRIGPFVARVSNNARHRMVEADGWTALVVGDVFDNGGDTVEQRLRRVASGDVLDNLASLDLGGRHAVILFRGDDFLVFNDPVGSRQVHLAKGHRRAVASHASLLAMQLGLPRDRRVTAFLQTPEYAARTVSYLPGNLSAYNHVWRLPPNHVYASRYGAMARFWPRAPRRETDEETVFTLYDAALSRLREHAAVHYQPVIAITGGVDTRSLIAHWHASGAAFLATTWRDFNIADGEQAVIDATIRLTGCEHHATQIPNPRELGDLEACSMFNSGEFAANGGRALHLDALRAAVRPRLDGADGRPPAFIIGYGGEIVRGFYRKEDRDAGRPLPPEAMTALYFGRKRWENADPRHVATATRAFRDFHADAAFDSHSLKGFDPLDLFYWEHRVGLWAASTLDGIDVTMHSLVGINSRRLFEAALGLPDARRLSKEIILRYVRRCDAELAGLPAC